MTTIAVVDLSGLFWSAYMSRKDADPVSAPHDWTVAKVRRFAERYPHIGIACDSRENWRKEISPAYKAGRAERGPEAWAQLEHTTETLRREGFPVWLHEGYEADDIMATVAHQAPRHEAAYQVVLVTNDKDLRACIRDGSVSVLTPGSSSSQPTIITEANCAIGGPAPKGSGIIDPRLVRDYIALTGDGSDNIPGVRGIGPVKAIGLLARFKSFPGIVAAFETGEATLMASAEGKLMAATLDPATGRRGIDDAKMSWLLADMKTDVPVDWSEALRERVTGPVEAATEIRARRNDAPRIEDAETEPVGDVPPTALVTSSHSAIVPVEWRLQCEPTDFDQMWDCAKLLANSRAFPSLKNPEQAHAAMMLGRAHGIPAVIAAMNCYPVKDRMSMSAGLIVGLCLRNERCEYLEWVEGDDLSCTWTAKRAGRPEKRLTFTLEAAKRAGYTTTRDGGVMGKDGMYFKDAETMLSARASTRLARRVFSDIVAGLYSAEELADGTE